MAEVRISIAKESTSQEILEKVLQISENSGVTLEEIANLIENGASPVIKSVQRGTVTADRYGDATVTISAVNPDKCIILLNGIALYETQSDGKGMSHALPIIASLSATSLVLDYSGYLTSSSLGNPAFSWQVIEFY